MAASLSLQCALAGIVILWSVFHFDQLPAVALRMPLPPVPRLAGPVVELVRTPAQLSHSVSPQTIVIRKMLVIPPRIPAHIPLIVDNLSDIAAAAPSAEVIGQYSDGVTGGVLNSVVDLAWHAAPPPRTHTEPAREATGSVQRIEVGGKVQEARLVHRVLPQYPALARAMRLSGKVQLVAVIGVDGKVNTLRVVSGHPLLIQSSVDAVRQWIYTPTLLNGKPVEVIAPVEVNFTMMN